MIYVFLYSALPLRLDVAAAMHLVSTAFLFLLFVDSLGLERGLLQPKEEVELVNDSMERPICFLV